MKFLPRVTVLLAIILMPCGTVSANVFSSPHDLYSQGYVFVETDSAGSAQQCAVCHFVHDSSRPRIWDMVPDALARYGPVGNTCASCHDGVSIVDRNVDAALTVFHPDSHGVDVDEAPSRTVMKNTGLEFETLECINCHDPHTQKNRPFLKIPTSGLCSRCHKDRGHTGFGELNTTGSHPVVIDPFDNTGGQTPIELDGAFRVPFPTPYPVKDGLLSKEGHWTLGGHLTFGHYGKIECSTCHAFHGMEDVGPVKDLLSKDPVNRASNEFCEGCHRGQRGDNREQPPYPNPGGTTTGRTYHPLDDDDANGIGWIASIADTIDLSYYQWGEIDPETELPTMLCTTCHVAHNGMENSPALVPIADEIEQDGVETFCQICHREPPDGHHGYESDGTIDPDMALQIAENADRLGKTYGNPAYDRIYCSLCHRAHNAGYDREEEDFIPILVDRLSEICANCHPMGVSHFLGDPTLPSTYDKIDPPLYRDVWPSTGLSSSYDGDGDLPTTITCLSCHYLKTLEEGVDAPANRLLAPADVDSEWFVENPEEYLCTGCHMRDIENFGEGHTHPTMDANWLRFPSIQTGHLFTDEMPVTYTETGTINCHSCHRTHNAVVRGGVYILKVVRGDNIDPKAIRPKIDFTSLCHSCHPEDEY